MSPSTRHLARHYVEMVIAMFAGMVVLGAPAGLVVDYGVPVQMLAAMGVTMTIPMAGWMRYRGHGWRATGEMSAAMILPTLAVVGLLTADVVNDLGTLLVAEHVAMLAAMLGAMLLRREEYAGHAHGAVAA